jgi:hypothetical protein
MNRTVLSILAAAASIICPSQSSSAQDAVKPEPKAAVLCSWMIYSAILHTGQTCRPQADAEFLRPLKTGVDRIEAFVFRNSEVTPQVLAAYNNRRPAFTMLQCTPRSEMVKLYDDIKRRGIEKIQQDIDVLLSEERPALWNPCL